MNLATAWASSETIRVLIFLLPGFVAAGIFQTLISNPKPSGVGIIVQAFIFTMLVQLVAQLGLWGIGAVWPDSSLSSMGGWDVSALVVMLVCLAIALGLVSAFIWNSDQLHRRLRDWGVTRESSYRSAQYSAFAHHSDCYVVLHLRGKRRLYGWPKEWPSRPEDQHFLIEECEWLVDDKEWEPLDRVSHMLVPASEVEMIEFLPMLSSEDNPE